MQSILDYRTSKLLYDLHTDRSLAAEYRKDREPFLTRYRISDSAAAALRTDDVAALAPLTNPFLLRYYFFMTGMTDTVFIARLQQGRAGAAGKEAGVGEIVGIFAASHAPPIVRDWDDIEAGRRQGLAAAFAELGDRIRAARPDVILVVGADHWANFFLDNMPALCIGVGQEHGGPPEPWLSGYPHATTMVGDPHLAMHLAEQAFAHGFEPSLSHSLRLDHAFCIPLWKAGFDTLPTLVPIVVNAIQNPVPTVSRCMAFGQVLADAIRNFDADRRVAILASGGLSHSVGEAAMGQIDEDFDHGCFEHFAQGDPGALTAFLTDDRIARAGNGASEVRFWAVAHGAAGCRGFEPIHYEAVPETYTGCGFAEWKLQGGPGQT